MKDQIRSYFKQHKEEIRKKSLALLSDLVATQTINAGKSNLKDYPWMKVPGEESKAVDVLKKYFDKEGIKYNVHEKIPGRGNLISTYGEGAKSLCVGCHLDIVPAGDPKLWNSDPFVMTEKDGFVYGRGTLDNKGPMVSSIMAMEILRALKVPLKGTFMLAAIAGEEFHENDEPDPGFEFLVKEGFLKPTFAIIPDIGLDMKKIDIAEKGRMVLKVTSIGKQAHGSTPEHGINAVIKLAHFIANAERLELKYQPHEYLKKPSVNLGIVRGGVVANSVPDTCVATYDIRYLPGQTPDGIVEEFKTCAKGIPDSNFKFEIESSVLPHQVAPDNVLVSAIQQNSQTILGFKPEVFGLGGGTFAKPFNHGGVIAVGFGPGDEDAFHVTNEYLEIEQMLQFAELLACISVDLLN